jgi:hypothetical protein
MKKVLLFCFLFIFLIGSLQIGLNAQEASDQATDDARVYYAHGIHGAAVGEDPTFPMDIYINGVLKMKAAKFGKLTGPKKVSPGNAFIDVYRAGEGPDTGHNPLSQHNFVFKPYENVTIAAYLDPDQHSVVQKFNNDLSPTASKDKCRVIIHNISAGWVDFEFYTKSGVDGHPYQAIELLEPGDKCVLELAKKILFPPYKGEQLVWQLIIGEGGEHWVQLYNKQFNIKPNKAILVYIAGSSAHNTFKVIKKTAPLK